MFKFSKKFLSLILAIIMLTMTAIGVNAHELSEEDIVSTEITDDVTVDKLSEVAEATEVVVSSTSEMGTTSNISENELEADEEELRPKNASRSIVTCASATGFSGANYSITRYSTGLTILCAGYGSIQKNYNSHADTFLTKIYAMQDNFNSLNSTQVGIWAMATIIGDVAELVQNIFTPGSGDDFIANAIRDTAAIIAKDAAAAGIIFTELERDSAAGSLVHWYIAEEEAKDAYHLFTIN